MSLVRDIERNVILLRDGWEEKVEHRVRVNGHLEARANTVRMAGLLDQLREYAIDGDPGPDNRAQRGSPNKAGSRPPGRVGGFILLDEINSEAEYWAERLLRETGRELSVMPAPAHLGVLLDECRRLEETHPGLVGDVAAATREWVRKARKLLAHDDGQVMFAGTVCGDCGGGLAVQREAATATAVRCVGGPEAQGCGARYEREQWLELLGERRLVETPEAVTLLVGQEASANRRLVVKAALYRWRCQSLITPRGLSANGKALWDSGEVEQALKYHIEKYGAAPWENGRGPGVKNHE